MRLSRILLGLILLLFSCDEDDTIETPGKFYALSEIHQLGYANEISAHPIVVRVLNTDEFPMEGVSVNFAVLNGAATLQNDIVMTDANGLAFAFVVFGEGLSNVIVRASIEELTNVVEFSFDVSSSPASTLELVSGDAQEGLAGADLAKPLVVRVTDDFGNIAKGFPIQFKVKTGNGEMFERTVLSNDVGEASAALTLSTLSPSNEVVAKIATDSILFTATSIFATNITALNRIQGGIHIHWEKSVNTTFGNYRVYRADTHNPQTFIQVATFDDVETIDWQDLTAVQGPAYFYKVAIETASGVVATSDVKQILNANLIALGAWAEDFVVDDSRNRIYVSMTQSNEIYIIDKTSIQIVDKVLIGSRPRGLSLSKDNTILYVALSGSGDVAMLNLETKAITLVNIEAALGAPSVFYVMEASSTRIFASAHTGSGAFTYLTMIKTDQNNQVVRAHGEIMRDRPTLQVEYGKFLYVNGDDDLYKIDVSTDAAPVVLSKNFFLSDLYPNHALSPDGTKILLLSGELLSTNDFSLLHNFDGSVFTTFNASGSKLYNMAFNFFNAYNVSSYERETHYRVSCREPVKFKISSDEKTIYLLSRDQNSFWLYFIENY